MKECYTVIVTSFLPSVTHVSLKSFQAKCGPSWVQRRAGTHRASETCFRIFWLLVRLFSISSEFSWLVLRSGKLWCRQTSCHIQSLVMCTECPCLQIRERRRCGRFRNSWCVRCCRCFCRQDTVAYKFESAVGVAGLEIIDVLDVVGIFRRQSTVQRNFTRNVSYVPSSIVVTWCCIYSFHPAAFQHITMGLI